MWEDGSREAPSYPFGLLPLLGRALPAVRRAMFIELLRAVPPSVSQEGDVYRSVAGSSTLRQEGLPPTALVIAFLAEGVGHERTDRIVRVLGS